MEFRGLEASDYEAWYALFRGYREFHHIPESAENIDRVWGWLRDPLHPSTTILAIEERSILGFANFRIRPRSIVGDHVIDLDDLYTDPNTRGRGVASSLIRELEFWARDHGCSEIHLQTNDWNTNAREFYRKIAEEMPWITIVKKVGDS
ncbi:GNAT family N-acetyltransferase [Homoserinimonas sp. OAct 916]|uniref:GNAT family N-acetyltransferase n=1 Tax=Homoserinimonas sp. OAct 916 TaxID=2211450 RepID=UPI0013009333|nr:GNAT family N-acetyltransferase [Homoserinimonas sp. OAct 916]